MYKVSCFFFTIVFLLSSFCVFSKTWYVDASAAGPGDGSRIDPYPQIIDALAAADTGDTIMVAASDEVYRGILRLKNGIKIYGGVGGPDSVIVTGSSSSLIRANGIWGAVIRNITFHAGSNTKGGAAYISDSSVRFENCIFSRNHTYNRYGDDEHGGAIYAFESILTAVACTFLENSAGEGDGGAIYLEDCGDSMIADSVFESNTAQTGGGGAIMINNSTVTISGCTFRENISRGGGGVLSSNSDLVIRDCLFEKNEVTYITGYARGGGLTIGGLENDITVENCRFIENRATDYGGGIYNANSSPYIIDCVFENNSTSFLGYGGGMYNYGDSSIYEEIPVPNIVNCTFNANTSPNGGAICNDDSGLQIVNCTIYGNRLENYSLPPDETGGSGIYNHCSPEDILVLNTIVWGNQGIDQIMDPRGRTLVRYSDVEGGHGGMGNINSDPLFRDPTAGDFHLTVDWFGTADSPCIDAGTPDTDPDFGLLPPYDFEGDLRIIDGPSTAGNGVDMGADEAKSLFSNVFLEGPSNITGTPGSTMTATFRISFNFNDSMPGITGWKKIFTATNGEIAQITMDGTDTGMLIQKGLATGYAYLAQGSAIANFTMVSNSLKLDPQMPFETAVITLMVRIPEKKDIAVLSLVGDGTSFMEFDNQKTLPFVTFDKPVTLIPSDKIK